MKAKKIRIGGGSMTELERFEPAVLLAKEGDIQYLCFENLAERTLAFAQRRKLENPTQGCNPDIEDRMRSVLPVCAAKGIKIITNAGAANPEAGAERVLKVIRELGLSGIKVAMVLGDDVRQLLDPALSIWETGKPLGDLAGEPVSANAYIGAAPIVKALQLGADIVITGRCADPSLFLAPLIYEFGWPEDDWHLMGAGTAIGHLLECSAYVTGGNYFDPGYTEDVPDLAGIGYPIAEVYPDGSAIITKVSGSGGIVTPNSCKAQLVYEIHDPQNYMTPDVTADFSYITLTSAGKDRVKVAGARGKERPENLKVSIGVMEGYIAEAERGWAGPGCYEKAKAAAASVEANLTPIKPEIDELRVDFIGVSAIFGPVAPEPVAPPNEVRVRIAGRTKTEQTARKILYECRHLLFGPVGTGGTRDVVRPVLAIYSTQIPRNRVPVNVIVYETTIAEVKSK